MGYHLNFTLIWRNFDKLWSGLILSLELALLSIAIGASSASRWRCSTCPADASSGR